MAFLDRLMPAGLRGRLFVAFALVLVMATAATATALVNLRSMHDRFAAFENLAGVSEVAAEIDAHAARSLLFFSTFLAERIEGDDERSDRSLDALRANLDKAAGLASEPDRVALLERVAGHVERYGAAKAELLETDQAIRREFEQTLDRLGPKVRESLQDLALAFAARNAWEAVAIVRQVNVDFVLARLYASNLQRTRKPEDHERMLEQLARVEDDFGKIASLAAEDAAAMETLAGVQPMIDLYARGVAELGTLIARRSDLQNSVFADIGPQIGVWAAEIKNGASTEERVLADAMAADARRGALVSMIVALGAIATGGVLAFATGSRLAGPIVQISASMSRLAAGDTTSPLPEIADRGEIGAMASTLEVFRDNAWEKQRLGARLADGLESEVGAMLSDITHAVEQLRSSSMAMAELAGTSRGRAEEVVMAANETASNVQTVAAATEELSSSIGSIGSQMGHARAIAQQAEHTSLATVSTMHELETLSLRIGEVVSLINDIADQTNLLALNATIEAARAGEAGRGFAVVASEVKSLAGQTAKATEQIRSEIDALQSACKNSVKGVDDVRSVISQLTEISLRVAEAVEQQSEATSEIARNVQHAAAGTDSVREAIAEVAQAADSTGDQAQEVSASSERLRMKSETIQTRVREFVNRVRAA